MIAAVIFDLYGTLLELPYDSRPFLQLAHRIQTPDQRSAFDTALCTQNSTLAEFASRLGLPPQEDLLSLQEALERDIQNVGLYPDAVPTLDLLKRRDMKIAVISNLATPYKTPLVRHRLKQYLDVAVFSCDCGLVKPDRRIYQLALDQLGTSADTTIMVGDSYKSDVEGSSQLGMKAIHLCRQGGSSTALTVITSLDSLLEYLSTSASPSSSTPASSPGR